MAKAIPRKAKEQQQKLLEWCDATWPKLYHYIYYRVLNREEAEDLTQEAYSRALPKFPSTGPLPSQAYLKTVALNLIRDRWRQQKTRGIPVPLEEALLLTETDEENTVNRALVEDLLNQLSADYRTVLQLRIIEGYSRAETARRMGRSEAAVRGLQYRAVQALRQLLTCHYEEVEPE